MNSIEKEFVPYLESLELKELGFNEPCLDRFYTKPRSPMFGVDKHNYYPIKNTLRKLYKVGEHATNKESNVINAPLFQQAFRWFREKYSDLDFGVAKIHNGTNNYHYHINLAWEFFEGTYEEAELACLRKLIEIIKKRTK